MERKQKYNEKLGILAPQAAIEAAKAASGGEEGCSERKLKLKNIQKNKEQKLGKEFLEIVATQYPGFPKDHFAQLLSHARSSGHVGKNAELYFSTKEQRLQALKNAVDLAVRGYLRHSYTDYDRQLSNLVVALNNDKIPEVLNREIKQEAMRKVDLILSAMESQSTPIYPDPGLTDY